MALGERARNERMEKLIDTAPASRLQCDSLPRRAYRGFTPSPR
jgi:hypothetical protein